ncbi:hypothetical protein C8R47DRAFT_1068967 [Mycena vitilis]|nr:hypothetical protein C8R47DRAFT_1068967 [Mycena vitilis]
MSFFAAVRREVATASHPIIRIAAPAPARCPRVVVPALPLPCAESAAIQFWGNNTTPLTQSAGVERMRPRTRRSSSEAPQPLPRSREIMKRRETDITLLKPTKLVKVAQQATLARLQACRYSVSSDKPFSAGEENEGQSSRGAELATASSRDSERVAPSSPVKSSRDNGVKVA